MYTQQQQQQELMGRYSPGQQLWHVGSSKFVLASELGGSVTSLSSLAPLYLWPLKGGPSRNRKFLFPLRRRRRRHCSRASAQLVEIHFIFHPVIYRSAGLTLWIQTLRYVPRGVSYHHVCLRLYIQRERSFGGDWDVHQRQVGRARILLRRPPPARWALLLSLGVLVFFFFLFIHPRCPIFFGMLTINSSSSCQ